VRGDGCIASLSCISFDSKGLCTNSPTIKIVILQKAGAASIRSASSPATGILLELDGASPMLVNEECGAGGSKVGTGVQEAASS